MAFQEDFAEFLDTEQGFAVEAIVTPKDGLAYQLKGIFVNNYYPIDIGTSGFVGFNPSFECCEEEARKINDGDILTIRQTKYKIVEIKQDDTGWVVLGLERQS
ncbi:head-tail joining protein [Candidatus Tisiphia endosymbiont of Micropterix aruncella]|uniref:head-tail joining protein n=1 Tax=Candidatus Tisiphia endosymbiont of Micropterix aruncella TaxID=3066271 RepID=UPI003AA84B12